MYKVCVQDLNNTHFLTQNFVIGNTILKVLYNDISWHVVRINAYTTTTYQ